MRYVSTRGASPVLDFADTLLAGLADDGGLYVPESWPVLGDGGRGDYVETAVEVMSPFVGQAVDGDAFAGMVADAYAGFDHPDVAPLVELSDGIHLMQLFHGPTLAFKDIALQLVGRLFDYELSRRGERVTIVGATSGDTGSAAIEACRDRERSPEKHVLDRRCGEYDLCESGFYEFQIDENSGDDRDRRHCDRDCEDERKGD